MKETDFWLYVGDELKTTATPPTLPPAPTGTVANDPLPTDAGTTDLAALAAEAGWDVVADAADVVTDAAETTIETLPDAPTDAIPWAWESPVDDAELQRMLDSLDVSSEKDKETTEELKWTIEEIKSNLPEWETEMTKKLDEALQKIADLEIGDLQNKKVIDVLKWEYEKTLSDKISLEYGTAWDSKIATLVNDDPDVKALIAAKLATGDDAKDKLAEARKAWWQNVSWVTVDQIIGERKNAETTAMWGWEDAGADLWIAETSLYV